MIMSETLEWYSMKNQIFFNNSTCHQHSLKEMQEDGPIHTHPWQTYEQNLSATGNRFVFSAELLTHQKMFDDLGSAINLDIDLFWFVQPW